MPVPAFYVRTRAGWGPTAQARAEGVPPGRAGPGRAVCARTTGQDLGLGRWASSRRSEQPGRACVCRGACLMASHAGSPSTAPARGRGRAAACAPVSRHLPRPPPRIGIANAVFPPAFRPVGVQFAGPQCNEAPPVCGCAHPLARSGLLTATRPRSTGGPPGVCACRRQPPGRAAELRQRNRFNSPYSGVLELLQCLTPSGLAAACTKCVITSDGDRR